MGTEGRYSQRAPGVPTAEHYALVPRAVVLHRIENGECLHDRIFWLCILWSWCGPYPSEDGSVVVKNEKGFIQVDGKGRPVHAKQKDLSEYLGYHEGRKGEISRAFAHLEQIGSIEFGKTIPGGRGAKVMYPIEEPPTKAAFQSSHVQATLEGWHIGTRFIPHNYLDAIVDPFERLRVQADLDSAQQDYLGNLRA